MDKREGELMAKDAYYFSHDSNAHNDTKILSMVCDYGMKGYGMFWVMVENLREQGEYKLKHEKSTWKALSMQMQCTVEEVKKYIEDCTHEYALFEMGEDLYFYSNSLNRRMDKYQDIKIKRAEAANKRWSNASAIQEGSKSNASALQNDAKEMKLKERKEKNIYTPDFEKFYSMYPRPEDKQRTFKNWNKCLKGNTAEEIMQAADKYKKVAEKENREKQYIKSSANFLGQDGCYKDYLCKPEDKPEGKIFPKDFKKVFLPLRDEQDG
jgi:hypothetical protein